MDEQQRRVGAGAGRDQHPPVDLLPVPRRQQHLLRCDHAALAQRGREVGEPAQTVRLDDGDVAGRRRLGEGDDDDPARGRDALHLDRAPGPPLDPALDVHPQQRDGAPLQPGDQHGVAVEDQRGAGEVGGGGVGQPPRWPVAGQHVQGGARADEVHLAGPQLLGQQEAGAVGALAGIGDVEAVGRPGQRADGGDRAVRAEREPPQRPAQGRTGAVVLGHHDGDGAGVGAEPRVVVVGVLGGQPDRRRDTRLRLGVRVLHRRRSGDGRLGAHVGHVDEKGVGAPVGHPADAVGQVAGGGDPADRLGGGRQVLDRPVAARLGHPGQEDQPGAVGRPVELRDAERLVGDRYRLAAGRPDDVQLRGSTRAGP